MKLLTNEAISRYPWTDSKNIGKDNFIIRLDAVAEAQIRSTDVEIRIRKDNTMKKRKINKEEEMKKLKSKGMPRTSREQNQTGCYCGSTDT